MRVCGGGGGGGDFLFLFYLNTENEWYEVKHTGKVAMASLIKM